MDEWGTWYDQEPGTHPGFLYQQNTLRDAEVAALTLNIFHRHTDRVKLAAIAQMVNVLQAMILTDKAEDAADADLSCLRHVPALHGRDALRGHRLEGRTMPGGIICRWWM